MRKRLATGLVPPSPHVAVAQRVADSAARSFVRTLTLAANTDAEIYLDVGVPPASAANDIVNMALAAANQGNWNEVCRLLDFAVFAAHFDSADAAAAAAFLSELIEIAWGPTP